MNTIITVAVIVAIGFLFGWAIVVGTGKSEVVECNKWSQEADAYPGYFLASWQSDQCSARGVIISVPVVK